MTNTIIVYDQMGNTFFDIFFAYSYLSVRFSFEFEILWDVVDNSIRVCTPIGESFIVTHVYRACPVLYMGFQTWVDFVIFETSKIYIIFRMTWFPLLCCN